MPIAIVTTKFYHPSPRVGEVARLRLFQKLDHQLNAGCPFFLVSAPPGFGKSTLVSAWTRRTRLPTAWLSLEKVDNEPFRFWYFVIEAFKTIFSDLNPDLIEILESPQTLPQDIVLPSLMNYLAANRSPFCLVIDDYHLIESQEIHEKFEEFLDHLPSNGHVVLVTRSDPVLHLARRRSRGLLCEIRAADLRFTSVEADEFFNCSMQLELSPDDVTTLESLTEGWITGLQLAAISLRDSENRQAFISAFHGEDRYITDYLVEEVLQRQPEHIQQFLMQTSYLQRLNASLCNAVTMRKDSSLILARIEADNLFLIPLDTQRLWFRYHHLFARLLNKKFEVAFGHEAVDGILHRASEECVRQGLLVEGVQYLLDSGDLSGAAALIFRLAHELFQQNELPTLIRWANQLPDHILARMPGLCIAFGWAAHATGHPELTWQYITWIEAHCGLSVENFLAMETSDQRRLPAETMASMIETVVMKARLLIDQGITRGTLETYLRILPWLVAERDQEAYANNSPSAMRPIMLFQAGLAYHLLGDPGPACLAFSESIQLSRQLGNHFLVALGMGYLGQIQAAQGDLSSAENTWKDALAYAQKNGAERDAFFSMAHIGLGCLAYERNDLDAAERLQREGIGLARNWAAWQGLVPGYTSLALTLQAKGDTDGAMEALDMLRRYQASAPRMIVPAEAACRALVWSRLGRPEWGLEILEGNPPQDMEQRLIHAEVLISANQFEKVGDDLDHLAREAYGAGLDGHLLRILVLSAVLLLKKDQPGPAQAAFEKALRLGEKECYLRTFIDQGEPVALLLLRLNQSDLAAYKASLLKAFTQANISPRSVIEQANALLAEPLTQREMQILQRIAQGIDNGALAAEYTISINTVKKHISHLFDKLQVENRLQAVEKARRLGILL